MFNWPRTCHGMPNVEGSSRLCLYNEHWHSFLLAGTLLLQRTLYWWTYVRRTQEKKKVSLAILITNCRYIPAGKKKRSPAILVHTVVLNMAFFNQVSGKKVFHKSKVTMTIILRPYTSCILMHLHLMRTGPVKWSQATVVTTVGISMVFFNQPFCKYELSPPEVSVTKYYTYLIVNSKWGFLSACTSKPLCSGKGCTSGVTKIKMVCYKRATRKKTRPLLLLCLHDM